MLNIQSGVRTFGDAMFKKKNKIPLLTEFKDSELFLGEEADGIYFRKTSEPESNDYDFWFVKFPKETIFEHNKDLNCDRWWVLLFEEHKHLDENKEQYNVVLFQSYLGDAMQFTKNQVKAGSQGLVIKKSDAGFNIMSTLLNKHFSVLDDIIEALEADYNYWKFYKKV